MHCFVECVLQRQHGFVGNLTAKFLYIGEGAKLYIIFHGIESIGALLDPYHHQEKDGDDQQRRSPFEQFATHEGGRADLQGFTLNRLGSDFFGEDGKELACLLHTRSRTAEGIGKGSADDDPTQQHSRCTHQQGIQTVAVFHQSDHGRTHEKPSRCRLDEVEISPIAEDRNPMHEQIGSRQQTAHDQGEDHLTGECGEQKGDARNHRCRQDHTC